MGVVVLPDPPDGGLWFETLVAGQGGQNRVGAVSAAAIGDFDPVESLIVV